MVLTILIFVGLLLFNLLLLAIQAKISVTSSDHPYHIGLIRGIRNNNRKFVFSHPNMLGEDFYSYPQYLHWLLSFLPDSIILKRYQYIGALVNTICLSTYLAFTAKVIPRLDLPLSFEVGFLLAGLLYITTPFSWAIWNAKNTGISARGIGILLLMFYQFSITLYLESENFYCIITLFIIVYIILYTSQFALQYIIFSSFFYAVFTKDIFFVLIPIVAVLIFWAIHPRLSKRFFLGQYWHKRNYSKFLAERFLFPVRYSIWRDFVYDFFVMIKRKGIRAVSYIYHNSVFSITLAIPALTVLVAIIILHKLPLSPFSFYIHIIIALALFFLTSFRATRFLGEPERYVEFSIPFITLTSISVVLEYYTFVSLIVLLVAHIALITFQFVLLHLMNKGKKTSARYAHLRETFGAAIEKRSKEAPHKIFTNNVQLGKFFLDDGFKILTVILSNSHTNGIAFGEILEDNSYNINENQVVPLINSESLSWVILDHDLLNKGSLVLKNANFSLEEIKAEDQYTLYKVHKS